jgi:hypothetical protein
MNKKKANLSAFTLVELAIVIVIIGLLVGGVLAGQELINQAKVRAQIKQFGIFDASALTFKGKYGFIPGDLTVDVASRFGFSQGSPLGGNGKLEDHQGRVPNVYTYIENRMFFVHMSEKKLIKENIVYNGSLYHYPMAELSPHRIAAVGLRDGVYYFLGPSKRALTVSDDLFSDNSPIPTLSPSEAYSLDEKLDDGIPSQGLVRAVTVSSGANNFANDTVTDNCLGTNNQTYNLTSDTPLCRLVIKAKVD